LNRSVWTYLATLSRHGGRLFVLAKGDPYALVPAINKIVRGMAAEQVVERAATLDDVRAEVLAPDRLNALVFGGFAGVALAISIVGVAGVLAFSVSGRIREFGIRLAIGSQPGDLLRGVIGEGTLLALLGVAAGALGGLAIAQALQAYLPGTRLPGVFPVIGAAIMLIVAAVIASVVPASRAARVDVMQALRSE
jgi:ABC-type antimicrobial peptide transport system permease subunit